MASNDGIFNRSVGKYNDETNPKDLNDHCELCKYEETFFFDFNSEDEDNNCNDETMLGHLGPEQDDTLVNQSWFITHTRRSTSIRKYYKLCSMGYAYTVEKPKFDLISSDRKVNQISRLDV